MLIVMIAFSVGMLAAAGSDLAIRRIPNWMNITICVAGLATRVFMAKEGQALAELGWGAAGVGLGLALLVVLFHFRWMGAGDVKLVAAIGAWLGPVGVFWAALIGIALGGIVSVVIALTNGAEFRKEVATNLKTAALSMSTPFVPKRGNTKLVPMGVAFGAAAIGVFIARGGL